MDLLSIGYLIGVSNTNVFMEVELGSCDIGDYGVKTLMKYLACTECTGTWKFDLNMNNIREEGAASIAEVLQNSDLIYSLNLTENPIGAGGLQSLAEALIMNTSLVELDLYQCSFEIIDENGPIVTEMLQRNTTLRSLNLMDAYTSDTGIVYIAQVLEENSALEYLMISGLDEVDAKALASAIATNASLPLVELTLRGYDMITEDSKQAFIDMLQPNTSVETLNLSHTGMSVPFLAEALQNNTTLEKLELCGCELTLDMVKDVSRMLTVNHSLTSLIMYENPIGDDGVTHLAEALKQNKTLKELDISYCNITDAGVVPLAEALKQNKTLEELDVSGCGITDAGLAPLAEALQVNSSLRQLNVLGNKLTENGLTKLRKLAAKKSNLQVVS